MNVWTCKIYINAMQMLLSEAITLQRVLCLEKAEPEVSPTPMCGTKRLLGILYDGMARADLLGFPYHFYNG